MTDRIHSLDALRTISIFFVVIIHTNPFQGFGPLGNTINFVIDGFARFGVPTFFMISGYLFSLKLSRVPDPVTYYRGYLRKLIGVYIFGTAFFLFGVNYATSLISAIVNAASPIAIVLSLFDRWWMMVSTDITGILFQNPMLFLYYGEGVNGKLWFLTALLYSIVIVYHFRMIGLERYLLPTALGFHIWGLIGQTYYPLLGEGFRSRDALFFGLFYVSLGYYIHNTDREFDRWNSWVYLGLFGVFAFVHLIERYFLGYIVLLNDIGSSVYTTNYQIATILMVLSLFLFALAEPELGRDTLFAKAGKYSVGVYIIHPGLIIITNKILNVVNITISKNPFGVVWEVFFTPAVFVSSLGLYLFFGWVGIVDYFYEFENRG